VETIIHKHKLLLFCGTGGVGKTTLSAATALKAAMMGKRVALVTIDPAKRLASALGLSDLSSEPQDISKFVQQSLKQKMAGSLCAMMLDSQDTLERFLEKVGGKETLQEFRANNLYQVISGNFSGTHDYLAMEKLFELHNSNNFDLIVLDTPPARHTLDFLDAPERIASFFDDRIFVWFLKDARSNKITEKLRATGARAALSLLEKITGQGVINDFVRLAPHIYKVKNAFVQRQSIIQNLIRSPQAGALFVSSPTDLARGEAEPFLDDAKRQNIRILGFIINRSLSHLCEKKPAHAKTFAAYEEIYSLVQEEQQNISRVSKMAKKSSVVILPELDEDIHNINGLYELSQRLTL
jgi:anion-transporting  ArsA/GET3 family ATPase